MFNRKWLLIPICLLAAMMFVAARWGIADFDARTTDHKLKNWAEKDSNFVFPEWERARRRAEFSRKLDPENPAHSEDLARLYLLRTGMPEISTNEKNTAFRHALTEFRAASQLRPASAYDWIMLMAVKFDLGEFDHEYLHAFDNAVFLGPWDQATALVVADSGLKAWNRLSEQQKSQVLQYIHRRSNGNKTR